MISYLLDTNMVSYIVRGKSAVARSRLAGLAADETACLSSITAAEMRYGLAKNPDAHKLHVAVEGFLAKVAILPWRREEAVVYGRLRAKLEISGKTLGNLDMLIAAHAIAVGAVMVTNDRALLRVEDEYATVNWATDIG